MSATEVKGAKEANEAANEVFYGGYSNLTVVAKQGADYLPKDEEGGDAKARSQSQINTTRVFTIGANITSERWKRIFPPKNIEEE